MSDATRTRELLDEIQRMRELFEQVNARCFALEGRMATFEKVDKIQGENRTQMLTKVLENQEKADKRIRWIELRWAMVAGGFFLWEFIVSHGSSVKALFK